MNLDRRQLKQLAYGGSFCLIVLLILFGVYWTRFKPTPPPPCPQCELQAKLPPPVVTWTKFFNGEGQTIVVAEVKNSNDSYGASILGYNLTIDEASSSKTFTGSSFIYPAQVKYLFALLPVDPATVVNASTQVTVQEWSSANTFSAPQLQLRNITTASSTGGAIAVSGTVDNQNAAPLTSTRIVAFLFNKNDELISASKTDLDHLRGFDSQPFTILFPKTVHLATPSPLPTFSYVFSQDLRVSNKGEDVRQLQRFLASQGFFKNVTNGIFDNATKIALIQFQKNFNLIPANGIFSSSTRSYINTLTKPPMQSPTDAMTVDSTKTKVYADGLR